jgi:monoamine oxidase
MARTTLFGSLLRIARAHAAERRGSEPDAPARGGFSRRTFLGAAGVVAAGLALPRVARAAGASDPRVVVVGAGISGLSAALALVDAGLSGRLTIYEASNRIGGRMFSNTPKIGSTSYWSDDQVTEWCGELVDSGHTTIQMLCARYNLTLDDLPVTAPAGSTPVYLFDGAYYTYDQVNIDFAPVFDAVTRDVTDAIPMTKNDGTPNDDGTVLFDAITSAGIALDNISVYEWIELNVPGGHTSKLGRLLDLAYASEYGADTTEQSSLNLVLLLAGLADPTAFEAFGASDERYHIQGGNQLLPLAIADDLKAKLGATALQMNSRLTKIATNADNTIALTFDVTSAGTTTSTQVIADAVILTVPFAVMTDSVDFSGAGFDARKIQAITQLGRGLCTKLQLQFNQRLWNQSGPWGVSNGEESFSDNGDQCSWHVTRGQPGTSGIINGYTGGTPTLLRASTAPTSFGTVNVGGHGSEISLLVTQFLSQLEQIYPGITARYNGKATLSIPHLDPNFKLSYAFWKVGQYQAFAGYERAPQGNIFFGGEHTSVNFQGFMEGGAAEGMRAAGEVVAAAMAGALTPIVPEEGGCCSVGHDSSALPIVPIGVVAAGLVLSGRDRSER